MGKRYYVRDVTESEDKYITYQVFDGKFGGFAGKRTTDYIEAQNLANYFNATKKEQYRPHKPKQSEFSKIIPAKRGYKSRSSRKGTIHQKGIGLPNLNLRLKI